jgi:hypothetical protein
VGVLGAVPPNEKAGFSVTGVVDAGVFFVSEAKEKAGLSAVGVLVEEGEL